MDDKNGTLEKLKATIAEAELANMILLSFNTVHNIVQCKI